MCGLKSVPRIRIRYRQRQLPGMGRTGPMSTTLEERLGAKPNCTYSIWSRLRCEASRCRYVE